LPIGIIILEAKSHAFSYKINSVPLSKILDFILIPGLYAVSKKEIKEDLNRGK